MFFRCLFVLLLVFSPFTVCAEDDLNPSCPDNNLLSGDLITKISWETMFPMRIAGVPMGGGDVPDIAADPTATCYCLDNNSMPELGYQQSMFEPARVVDVTRIAGCSMSLGGVYLDDSTRSVGHIANSNEDVDKVFYHYSYYAFPLLTILDLFTDANCNKDGYMDLDLMYTSFIDPTYTDDELAFMMAPEVAWAATPLAMATQIPDCLAASAGISTDKWFWTAGCWGNLYPFTGNMRQRSDPPRDANLIATRALASLHRRGLARKTAGNDAMCEGEFSAFIPKSQYRWSMFYPVAEVETTLDYGSMFGTSGDTLNIKGYHIIGESPFLWGEWRNIPATGEDFTFVLWRWNDCCARD